MMQTVAVQVQDNYMPQFINYIEEHSSSLSITKDKNLEYDPYFYERKKELQQIINDIDNSSMKMLSEEESEKELDLLFVKLENEN